MASPPAAGVPQLDPMFVWMELNRRLDGLTRQVEHMDQVGTRGVDGLRLEMTALREALAGHEEEHRAEQDDRRVSRRWVLGAVISAALAFAANPFIVYLAVGR